MKRWHWYIVFALAIVVIAGATWEAYMIATWETIP